MIAPDEITAADLDCVVMPDGEVICLGKTLGQVGDFGGHLAPRRASEAAPAKGEVKVIGVHDACTYKPMIAFRVAPANERERRILARAGFGQTPEEQAGFTFFYDVNRRQCAYDPCELADQTTCGTAARRIGERGFDALPHGAFIDCELLRGEKDAPLTFEDEFDGRLRRAASTTTRTA